MQVSDSVDSVSEVNRGKINAWGGDCDEEKGYRS